MGYTFHGHVFLMVGAIIRCILFCDIKIFFINLRIIKWPEIGWVILCFTSYSIGHMGTGTWLKHGDGNLAEKWGRELG